MLEVIVAMAVFSLIATSLASLALGGFSALEQGGEETVAVALAQEGMEAVRSIRDGAWNENTYTQSGVAISGGQWVFSGEGTTDTVGQYVRTLSFADVCRDGSDAVVACPGSYVDTHARQATVTVDWSPRAGITNTVQRIAYLTNWDSREWVQTDWSGGSGQTEWSDDTQYDSDDSNLLTSTVGQLSLVSGDTTDDGFSQAGSATYDWPFTTSSNYVFDSNDIEFVSGQAQLKQSGGGTASGDTTNDQFTSDASGWAFASWGVDGGEVTPTGTWQSSGGDPGGFVDIDVPSNARNDEVGGYWEQALTITENGATVTCSFDWRISQWVVDSGVNDYQLYVFLDSASGDPTIGQQVWASGTQSGTTSWSGQQNIDCSSAAATSGTYYYKIAVWVAATNKSTGPLTAGYDNALVHWEKTTGGSYPTNKPAVYPTTSLVVAGVTSWDSFTETATKNGGEIYYQLSNDDGVTWQYWNGSAWVVAGATDYIDAATVNTNIGSFGVTNEQIMFQAFLESDGTQLVQLDNLQIGYATPAAVWSFAVWDVGAGEVTPTGTLQPVDGNPAAYADVTVPAGDGDTVGGYWEQAFTTYTDSPSLITIDFDYRVFDYNDAPLVTDIRVFVDSTSGTPTNQVGSSLAVTTEGGWTSAPQIDATAATPTAGTYYLKVAFWVETGTGGDRGPWTVGFDNVNLDLTDAEYPLSGTLTSSAFDMGDVSPVQIVAWDEVVPVCLPVCDVDLEVASAPDASGSPGAWTGWYGASGIGSTFDTTGPTGVLVPSGINGNQWVRYRVTLTGDGSATPVVRDVSVNYK